MKTASPETVEELRWNGFIGNCRKAPLSTTSNRLNSVRSLQRPYYSQVISSPTVVADRREHHQVWSQMKEKASLDKQWWTLTYLHIWSSSSCLFSDLSQVSNLFKIVHELDLRHLIVQYRPKKYFDFTTFGPCRFVLFCVCHKCFWFQINSFYLFPYFQMCIYILNAF